MSLELIVLIGLPLAFIIYCIIIISIFFSPTSIKSIINGSPPIPSPKEEIRYALKAAELSKGDIFYDLGSGTGRVVNIAKKDFGAEAIGIEYSLFWFLFSKINLFIHGTKAKVYRKNFLKQDISDADVLYTYISSTLMKKLEKRLEKEKISVKIVSYCFSFPNLEVKKKIISPKGKPILIYQT